jgi:hypothetical protein
MKTKHILLPLVIGGVASLADAWLLSNLWAAFDWRRPIAEWLVGMGFTTLAGWFGLVWIRVPTFVVAGFLGVIVERLFPERWISAVSFCALGFVGVSFLLMTWFVGFLSPSAPGWGTALKAQAWSAVSVVLLLLGAWLHARRRANSVGLHARPL